MPSVERLKERLHHTLKAKKLDAALGALMLLSREEPDEPRWPRRTAHLMHIRSDREGELTALRQALKLQVDQGLALDAITSAKAILDLVPDDDEANAALGLLVATGPRTGSRRPDKPAKVVNRSVLDETPTDAPLDAMLLTEIVPGSRSLPDADGQTRGISEIPIDPGDSSTHPRREPVLDLRLEESSAGSASGGCTRRGRKQATAGVGPSTLASSVPKSNATAGEDEKARKMRSRLGQSGARGQSLREELANVPLFGDLDAPSLHSLIRKARVVSLKSGEVLFRQGDAANSLYVIVAGAVVPIAEGAPRRKLAVLEPGEFFGEIGLLGKRPRNATIEALVDSKLLAIDRRALWTLIKEQPSVAKNILRFFRARLVDRQIRTNLFFSAFALAERDAVARQFRFLEVKEGATLIEAGEPPEGLFVVLSGGLDIVDPDSEKSLGALGLGDVFGGLALIDGRPSPGHVVAKTKSWLVVLGEGRFRKILDANPRLDRVLRRIALESPEGAHADSVIAL